jgi:hypothetical protein
MTFFVKTKYGGTQVPTQKNKKQNQLYCGPAIPNQVIPATLLKHIDEFTLSVLYR